MPTIFRHDGFRVAIYPNDHRPAHVHVVKPDRQAVFILNCPNGPPELRENDGLSAAELRGVVAAIAEQLALCCERWRAMHDDY
jgi:hypothetical protein